MQNSKLKTISLKLITFKFIIIVLIFIASILATAVGLALAEEKGQIDPGLVSCLKGKMGEEIFNSIKSGSRQPTAEEGQKGEECFAKYGKQMKRTEQQEKRPEFSESAKTCLVKTLGADFEQQFANAKSEEEGRKLGEKARSCFGGKEVREEIPASVKTCIESAVGKDEAIKMFQGERPSSDSAIYKKLDGAGCFKGIKHGGNRSSKMEDVPAEKRQCIESVMGNLQGEPTEEQRQQVGAKCFGGGKPGESGGRQQLPAAVQSCLRSKLGNGFMEKSPGAMTAEEKNSAGECFKQHNFTPEGADPGNRAPSMSESTKTCIEGITGQPMSARPNLTDVQKNEVNSKCFGGKADELTGEGGSRGKTKNDLDQCTTRITGGAPGPYSPEIQSRINSECLREKQTEKNDNPRANPDKQACVERIANDASVNMTYEERQAKINAECFAAERYGKPKDEAYDSGQSNGAPPGASGPRPEGSVSGRREGLPGGCTDSACVEQYCAANPSICAARPQ